ncbi:pyridoxamine 5'-phosphate oxidase family protein [Streptomyces guryensis]|uniref:Pyridoxamine 5'-phosphate oxidase family protein n=1 Tax=Streptomyces guryensis TaxID=2886947 RepID=A0A9Q3VIM2_9ACTN|nr:pyridoxamine 5'-phosphate oxidase family protein [Streptomyces guryensis]MCD9872686.1 pyridoxamine 5'-phosphate oxidase family protein [Streptomyces guryensis]
MNPGDIVRAVVDTNLYMVLATADADGRPWSSPVYFAHEGYREFFWVSAPDVLHSRNIAVRSGVGISVFDSSVAISTGQGVYVSATAARVDGPEAEHGLDVFSGRSVRHGGRVWTAEDVGGDSGMRLYRAVAHDHSILAKDGRPDHRIPATCPRP